MRYTAKPEIAMRQVTIWRVSLRCINCGRVEGFELSPACLSVAERIPHPARTEAAVADHCTRIGWRETPLNTGAGNLACSLRCEREVHTHLILQREEHGQ